MIRLLPLLLLILTEYCFGYAHFIGHGYTSCINCHFNPSGGGMLNDYGRAVSATTISSRIFNKKTDEEKLAYTSGFLFRKPKQEFFRTQVNYRGFQLVRNPGSKVESKEWINMQADLRGILKFGEQDKFLLAGSIGYSPPAKQPSRKEDENEFRTREYYLGYRATPRLGFYAGLMDKTYGVKLVEHIAYSRTTPQVTQNDQTHGLLAHYLGSSFEAFAHYFQGNLADEKDQQSKGFSAVFEKTIFTNHRLGASFIKSGNEYFNLTSYALQGKFNLHEGSALLFELGEAIQDPANNVPHFKSRYGMIQTYLRPWQGVYVLTNIEYVKRNLSEEPYTIRWGPGIQFFPIQRVELRADFYNTRNFDPKNSTKDTWMYLLQTHIWL